jgi:hypothetical protein
MPGWSRRAGGCCKRKEPQRHRGHREEKLNHRGTEDTGKTKAEAEKN